MKIGRRDNARNGKRQTIIIYCCCGFGWKSRQWLASNFLCKGATFTACILFSRFYQLFAGFTYVNKPHTPQAVKIAFLWRFLFSTN